MSKVGCSHAECPVNLERRDDIMESVGADAELARVVDFVRNHSRKSAKAAVLLDLLAGQLEKKEHRA